MSQCKRSCIASICANGRFTYVFGDLDPETPDHLDALILLSRLYLEAPEGFLSRAERPEPLRAGILGRLPPPETESPLVTRFEPVTVTRGQQVEVGEERTRASVPRETWALTGEPVRQVLHEFPPSTQESAG